MDRERRFSFFSSFMETAAEVRLKEKSMEEHFGLMMMMRLQSHDQMEVQTTGTYVLMCLNLLTFHQMEVENSHN